MDGFLVIFYSISFLFLLLNQIKVLIAKFPKFLREIHYSVSTGRPYIALFISMVLVLTPRTSPREPEFDHVQSGRFIPTLIPAH